MKAQELLFQIFQIADYVLHNEKFISSKVALLVAYNCTVLVLQLQCKTRTKPVKLT